MDHHSTIMIAKHKTSHLLALCIAMAVLSKSSSAQLDPTWIVTDPGPTVGGLAADSVGGVIAVGTTAAPADASVRSYDANGALRWSVTLDSGLGIDDGFRKVAVAPNGDIIVAGGRVGFSGATYVEDVLLYRFDAAGNLLWSQVYDGPFGSRQDSLSDMRLGPGGSILLAGQSSGPNTTPDLTVWKYDAAGNLVWVVRADGVAGLVDFGSSLAVAANGDVYACGASSWSPAQHGLVFTVKVSTSGSLLWSREYWAGGSGPHRGNAIRVSATNHVYVAADVFPSNNPDSALISYDTNGNLSWIRTAVDDSRTGTSAVVTDGGDIVLLSGTYDAAFAQGMRLDSYDESGNLRWTLARPRMLARGMLARAQGAVEIFGNASPMFVGLSVAFLARYENTGQEAWIRNYDVPVPSEEFTTAAAGPGESLFLGGWPPGSLYLSRWDESGGSICYGDGLGTACPCNNISSAASKSGCSNSLGLGGKLVRSGTAQISADSLQLTGSGMPDSAALYFQGTALVNGGMGVTLGDGLRCVGGSVQRLGIRTNAAGMSQYPLATDPPIHVRGAVTSAGSRAYQVWYRNASAFCAAATYNLTNAMLVSWTM